MVYGYHKLALLVNSGQNFTVLLNSAQHEC